MHHLRQVLTSIRARKCFGFSSSVEVYTLGSTEPTHLCTVLVLSRVSSVPLCPPC